MALSLDIILVGEILKYRYIACIRIPSCLDNEDVFMIAYIPFVHKSLQNYNDFVWTVTRLNRDMNNS